MVNPTDEKSPDWQKEEKPSLALPNVSRELQ
jgi:hypothetical protein